MSECRSCGAPIVWVKLTSGKAMPCDPTVIEADSVANRIDTTTLVLTDGTVRSFGGDILPDSGDGAAGRISHFATCPNAKTHRKAKRP